VLSLKLKFDSLDGLSWSGFEGAVSCGSLSLLSENWVPTNYPSALNGSVWRNSDFDLYGAGQVELSGKLGHSRLDQVFGLTFVLGRGRLGADADRTAQRERENNTDRLNFSPPHENKSKDYGRGWRAGPKYSCV
jgi:hypothetical protein